MSPRRIVRFAESNAQALAYLVVSGVAVIAVAGVVWEADQRTDAIRAESVARSDDVDEAGRQICGSIEQQNDLLGDLISVVVEPSPNVTGSIIDTPEFRALDADVQAFVRRLAAEQDTDGLAERLIEFRASRLTVLPEFCVDLAVDP